MREHASFEAPMFAPHLAAVCGSCHSRVNRRAKQRDQRARQTSALAFARRAAKAGLPVNGVAVDGIEIKFGETAKEAELTPLEAWKAKRRAR